MDARPRGPPERRNVYERGQSLAWVPVGRDGASDGTGQELMAGPGAPQDLVTGSDGLARCWWAAATPLLEAYHDGEWARGPRDERALFERLSLEAFQAGLSWRIVLERRATLRAAFADFDPAVVAGLGHAEVEGLMAHPGMIRNRAKITAVVSNARVLLGLHAAGSGLRAVTEEVLAAAAPAPRAAPTRRTDVPASTDGSAALARHLRSLGWRFIGPTIAYAYLQAVGWVDDHLAGCHARGRPADDPTVGRTRLG
jgi:DNA-3-methyladenine glycosylase I